MLAVRRLSSCLGVFFVTSCVVSSAAAEGFHSQIPKFETRRLSLDWGYGLSSWYERRKVRGYTSNGSRSTVVVVDPNDGGFAHGLGVGLAFSLEPWMGLGLDAQAFQFFDRAEHPWLEELGVSLGKRTSVNAGIYAEFRPWVRQYRSRPGAFFSVGLRAGTTFETVNRDARGKDPDVAVAGSDSAMVGGWLGAGYRVYVTRRVSLHIQTDVGGFIEQTYVGFRVGGGIQ